MSAHGIVVAPHHDPLPSLPIPSLDETLDKYLKYTALHLSSEEERAEVRAIVERFRHTDGPQLQAQLLQRSASATTSWLLDWWTQLAYLAYPDSLPIWSNFYCQFNPSSSVPKDLSTLVSQPGIPSIQAVRSAIWYGIFHHLICSIFSIFSIFSCFFFSKVCGIITISR